MMRTILIIGWCLGMIAAVFLAVGIILTLDDLSLQVWVGLLSVSFFLDQVKGLYQTIVGEWP